MAFSMVFDRSFHFGGEWRRTIGTDGAQRKQAKGPESGIFLIRAAILLRQLKPARVRDTPRSIEFGWSMLRLGRSRLIAACSDLLIGEGRRCASR